MTARIVSAEEARGLLAPLDRGESWTYQPGVDAEHDPWLAESAWIESAPTGAPDSGGDIVAVVYRWDSGRGRLAAAAPDLAHTVIALEGAHMEALTERAVFEARALVAEKERDAALARVARLERVLAVERGDEVAAPPNWWRRYPDHWSGGSAKHVIRDADGLWWWGPDDPKTCPLEAMEAADAAQDVTP